MGTKTLPRRGLPPPPADKEKLQRDFLPIFERVISGYGVEIDGILYFDDVLRPYIGLTQPENPTRGIEYPFRRDPRDVSQIYFFEATTQRYYVIRSPLPPLSIWELRELKTLAKQRGIQKPDERQMFEILTEMRDIEQAAADKSKAARSAQQQRAEHKKARDIAMGNAPDPDPSASESPTPDSPARPPPPVPDAIKGYDPSKVRPIEDDDD